MGMTNPHRFPFALRDADQVPDLAADGGRFINMVEKHIPLGKGQLELPGGRKAERSRGGAAVDEEKPPFFEHSEYLVQLGVSPKRIFTISYGEEKPINANQDEEAWAENRRDHFMIR